MTIPVGYAIQSLSESSEDFASEEEIVLSGMEIEVEKTALAIFGNDYTLMKDISERSKDKMRHYNIVAISSLGLSIPFGIITTVLAYYQNPLGVGISGGMTLASVLVGGAFRFRTQIREDFATKEQGIIDICDAISEFSNVLLEFKENPDSKNIALLFQKFSRIEVQLNLHEGLVTGEDLKLFTATGKLFLMDAVVKILKNVNKDDLLANQWETLLNSISDTTEAQFECEPWESCKILNPGLDSYHHFFDIRDEINSVELDVKIISIFKKILENPDSKKVYYCFD